MPTQRFIFAGGGTGGHLFPALAIADELRRIDSNVEVLFVGTKDKLEARIVPQHGYGFRSIWISGFQRRKFFRNFLFPIKVFVSLMQSRAIIKEFKPSAVIGTGGYVSGPVLFVATQLGIPTAIHEQNSYPGVTTRQLGKRVDIVFLTFKESIKHFSNVKNCVVAGNPTRHSLVNVDRNKALNYFGFNEEQKHTVLIFGGSLGAHSINKAVLKNLDKIIASNIRVIWQTGNNDIDEIKSACEKYPATSIWVNNFIDQMDFAYALGDVVVCRSGATTIAELTRLGKPAILIPYPHAAADHQTHNAQMLADADAAKIVRDADADSAMYETLMSLLNDNASMQRMSLSSKKLGRPNAASDIAVRIIELAKNKMKVS